MTTDSIDNSQHSAAKISGLSGLFVAAALIYSNYAAVRDEI